MSQPADPLFSTNFANLIGRAGEQFGGRPAMVYRGQSVSFAALSQRAAVIASALRGTGIRTGDRCAVLIKEPMEAAAAFFAILAVGGIGINVNELYRPRQIEYVLRHSGAVTLLTSAGVLEQLTRRIDTDALVVDVAALSGVEQALEIDDASRDDAAQVTYTSASTGLPKGVLMSHGALWAGVRIVASYLGLRGDDRIASLLPFSFVYGFNQLTTSLYTGATLVVERSTLAAEIVAACRRERVTVVAGVPPLWQQLLGVNNFRETPLEHLRIMTCAGGRLTPATVRELRQLQPQAQLFLMYGLTEVFRSTYLPPEEVDAHPDSMGRAIPESTVYVVRDDGTIADADEIGELVHGGPTVGMGYLADTEATARVFKANPFLSHDKTEPERVVYSGDLVRRDGNGLLYYVGRRDRMIKTLGFRVSPDEIGDVIQASGQVSDVAVVSEPDAARGERIVACIVLRGGCQLDAVTRFCRLELPRHMQPARYEVLETIPRNANGKHDILFLRHELLGKQGERET